MAVACAAVTAAVVTVVAVATGDDGDDTAAPSTGSGLPSHTAPPDGSGFDTAEWDQPMPIPAGRPLGGEDCDWMEKSFTAMQRELGVARIGVSGTGCVFVLEDDSTRIQVVAYGPYNRITEPTSVLEPVEIAGVPGRVYSFGAEDSTHCAVELATRSIAVPQISVSNTGPEGGTSTGGSRERHCELAKTAARIIAEHHVPLAGGTPSPLAVQELPDDVAARYDACTMGEKAAFFLDVEPGSAAPAESGRACAFEGPSTRVRTTLTGGGTGLDGIAPVAGAETTDTRLGPYPMRTDRDTTACTVSLEFGDRSVLQLRIEALTDEPAPTTCHVGRVGAGQILATLLEETGATA